MSNSVSTKTHSEDNRASDNYHPSYSFPSADIVLLSNDGVKFRVHSSILATASKFFHDMFGMPRSAAENPDDALPMGESSKVISTLLDIIYPHDADPFLPSVSFKFLRRLLTSAEKYDLARVNHYVRLLTKTEPFLSRPLEVYALACTFGWDEDTHKLSLQTLNVDLSSPAYVDVLKSMDSASLHKILQLRWEIKGEVLKVVQKFEDADISEMWGCGCSEAGDLVSTDDYEFFENFIRSELDKYPDGSSLRCQRFWYDGLERLWDIKCHQCDKPVLERRGVETAVISALDQIHFKYN
ncbi:hypothetical protein BD410DRAFT_783730 [Rickenella mellea]|uniref:BTB domain-containing protein n=1 Tax=Rickenella mellea TaxID=50990 RepID=A0A4Y7QHF2_9AGAM|nr:hypothetical protein BD410DRAFT_783730 [Rickenella mellea]